MTNEQFAAYLEMLAERLDGIRGRLVQNLDNAKLERHPDNHAVDIPFHETKLRPHPRADQPVCLDELANLIFELRTRTRLLTEKPKSDSSLTDQLRRQWGVYS
jgi:hypothetical protein